MTRHMIGADRKCELRIPQDSHDLEEIHHSLIRIYFCEIVKPSLDIAHMYLMDLPAFGQILDDGKYFQSGSLQALSCCSKTQLEAVIRAINDSVVPLERIEDRRGVPILRALIAERKTGRVIGMACHADIVLLANGNYALKKVCDALPIVVRGNPAGLAHRKVLPVLLEFESLIGSSTSARPPIIPPDRDQRPVI